MPSHTPVMGPVTPEATPATGSTTLRNACCADSSGPKPRKSSVMRVTAVATTRATMVRERPPRADRAMEERSDQIGEIRGPRAGLARGRGREQHAAQRLELLEGLARPQGH